MSVQTPIVNAGLLYVNGLRLTWTSTTVITVASGAARDSTNVNDITLSSSATITTTTSGAGGLDTGTIANATFYAVYVIGDSTGYNDTNVIISTSATGPLQPFGYDMFRRIGYVKTDGSAHFLEFRQDGVGSDRWMWYDAPIATGVTNGSSATYASVDCSAGLPAATPTMVNFYCAFTPTAGDDTLVLAPGTSTSTLGYATLSGSVAAVVKTGNLICPTDSPLTDAIDYKVTGSATAISVAAYLDQLS